MSAEEELKLRRERDALRDLVRTALNSGRMGLQWQTDAAAILSK